MNDSIKHGLDAAAAVTAASTLAGFLPPIAALLSIIWLLMQMKDRADRKRKEREADEQG